MYEYIYMRMFLVKHAVTILQISDSTNGVIASTFYSRTWSIRTGPRSSITFSGWMCGIFTSDVKHKVYNQPATTDAAGIFCPHLFSLYRIKFCDILVTESCTAHQ